MTLLTTLSPLQAGLPRKSPGYSRHLVLCIALATMLLLPTGMAAVQADGAPASDRPVLCDEPDETQTPPETVASDKAQLVKISPLLQTARRAVERGVQFVKSQQQDDGTWPFGGKSEHMLQGSTALATLALLRAGVPVDDPAVVSALKYLRSKETQYTYALSLKTLVWLRIGGEDERVRSNIARLTEGQVKKEQYSGSWGYQVADGAGSRGDNSNMWFAVNALATAQAVEFKVDPEVWTRLISYLRKSQRRDGGWNYVPTASNAATTGSMTYAGLGSLMRAAELADDDDDRIAKARDHAVDWLGRHFSVTHNPGAGAGWHLYSLMAMRYAAEHQKLRLLGEHDWYREGVNFLSRQQSPRDGSWRGNPGPNTPAISASMALLFLCPLNEQALSDDVVEGAAGANRKPDAGTPSDTVTGQVIATKKSKSGQELVEVSIGRDDGVRPNATMRVFHADKPEHSIAAIRVALVTPDRCVGFVVERDKTTKIGITDITRLVIRPSKPDRQKTSLPEVNGAVLATKKTGAGRELVEVSVGSDDAVRVGTLMHMFRKVDKRNVYLGQIRIELVTPDRSVGVVIIRAKAQVIGVDDQVSTKLDPVAAASLLDGDSLLDALDGIIEPGAGGGG